MNDEHELDSNDNEVVLKAEYRLSSERAGVLAYGLKVKIIEARNIPPDVFVFHRETKMLATGFPFDYRAGALFQNVATPVDIEETPSAFEATPDDRYFRDKEVTLIFRNKEDADQAKSTIDEDLSALSRSWMSLNDTNNYEVVETKEYKNG